jgi:hypothetical protein
MRNLKIVYLLLFIVGTVVPTYFFIQFLNESNLDANAFIGAVFGTNPSANFGSQVLISVVVFWVFMFSDSGNKNLSRNILLMILTFSVGLSSSLPLYLYLRERKRTRALTTDL